ncbi:phage tail protein [Halospeciosus flavus]|uniref:Phage tail protein n=1 Tax=Halospeciosus flavus TaxID=3032283 RepID=A0ABD5Z5I3_9EURY|nr:phage tail protein [Halospeciosus flavus]
MPRFPVNTHRRASYKQSSFAVKWDGAYIEGVYRVSGLTRTTDVVAERGGTGGAVPTSSPGLTNYDPIVLERGRTHDDAFESWANQVYDRGRAEADAPTSLGDYEKDVVVELGNAAGQVVMAFRVYRAWTSSYTALSELDASESGLAVERLVLQHAGWERDRAVSEPSEPTFDDVEQSSAPVDGDETTGGPAFDPQLARDATRWRATPWVVDRWRVQDHDGDGSADAAGKH